MKRTAPAAAASAAQRIDQVIASYDDWRGKALARVRALIHAALPDVVEEWKWDVPVWSHGGILCTGETYRSAVKLTFPRGASLPDPTGLFNASLTGHARRAIDIREGDTLDARAFKALVKAAAAANVKSAARKTRADTTGGSKTTRSRARTSGAGPSARATGRTSPRTAKPATNTSTPKAAATPTRRKAATTRGKGETSASGVRLLSGGNPQIPKGDGDAPVQAYIAAVPDWRQDVCRWLDDLIVRAVPGVRKAVKWNSPFYGVEGRGWFLSFHVFTRYVKVTFFRGGSLLPKPPGASKDPQVRYLDIRETDPRDEAQVASWVKQASVLPGWLS